MPTSPEQRLAALFRETPEPTRLRVAAPAVVAFLVVFGLACGLIGAAIERVPGVRLEEPGTPRIKAKHLEEHGDEYDVVFVGSSRVFRNLRPQQFERELSQRGFDLRAYSLGLPGMRFYEAIRAVEELLEDPPERLRYVVLELLNPDPELFQDNLYARREIAWHTPALTRLAIRRCLASDRPPLERLRMVLGHLVQFGCRATNAGTAERVLAALRGETSVPDDGSPGGFVPLELDPTGRERRRVFLEELNADRGLLEARAERIRGEQREEVPDALLIETLEHLVRLAREAGVEPVFLLVPPLETRRPEMVGAFAAGVLPNLFSYVEPDEHPDLYLEFGLFYDKNHYDREGAQRLTRRLADDFADYLVERGGVVRDGLERDGE